MKLKFTRLFVCACMALGLLINSASAGSIAKEDPKAKKTTRLSSSRNNSSVRIYPDIVKRVMHIVAKDNEGVPVDFFVFDLQGTLVKHYKMKGGDHEKLADLERGKYIFRVFSGDEETAMGNLEIR